VHVTDHVGAFSNEVDQRRRGRFADSIRWQTALE
jgi:hypothetical protein